MNEARPLEPRSSDSHLGGSRFSSDSDRLASASDSGRLPLPREVQADPAQGRGARAVSLLEFGDDDFDELVLRSDLPVLVHFWTESCVPCHLQEPNLRQLAGELQGQLVVGKLNAYHHPGVPERFQIKAVPHLLLFRDGEVLLDLVGGRTLDQLRLQLAEYEIRA
jgi:thioredoxin